mgnify:CR=1 FL=1
MRAIILAAGRGSRMGDLTQNKPKCFVKVNNKTLLELQTKALNGGGVTKISIVTGYKREVFKNFSLELIHNNNWANTNMIDSLICANSLLEKEECIVSYSDIFYNKNIIKLLTKSDHPLSISYDVNWKKLWFQRFNNPLDDAESFKISKNNFLIDIGKKSNNLSEIEGQYMGLLKFNPTGWKCFKTAYLGLSILKRKKMSVTSLLDYIVRKSIIDIKAIPYEEKWGEVDTINDVNFYNSIKFK